MFDFIAHLYLFFVVVCYYYNDHIMVYMRAYVKEDTGGAE